MTFYKCEATGNDFIVLDFSFAKDIVFDRNFIQFLCDRHFGIGSDGLLIILKDDIYDFRMKFFNPDGSKANFCGNGARCISLIANILDIAPKKGKFVADDGFHSFNISENQVSISLKNIDFFYPYSNGFFVDSGTQHVVLFYDDIQNLDIIPIAKKIRYSEQFKPLGTNVNFVQVENNQLFVRTYEKGVESETLSCGTGVVASAIAYALKNKLSDFQLNIKTKGGQLKVSGYFDGKVFKNIFLSASANFVFKGHLNLLK